MAWNGKASIAYEGKPTQQSSGAAGGIIVTPIRDEETLCSLPSKTLCLPRLLSIESSWKLSQNKATGASVLQSGRQDCLQ